MFDSAALFSDWRRPTFISSLNPGALGFERALKGMHPRIELVEIRLDGAWESAGTFLGQSQDFTRAQEIIRRARKLSSRPVLATFRTADEGGKAIEASAYRDLLLAVARSGKVGAIDVEAFRDESTVREIIDGAHEAGVAVVASYHDFHATPAAEEILARFGAMDAAGADVLKLACMPASVDDLLVLLSATHQASHVFDRPLITVAMGPIGVLSRVAGGIFGSCATFAAVGRGSAPGQIPVSDLRPALDLLDSTQPATFQSAAPGQKQSPRPQSSPRRR